MNKPLTTTGAEATLARLRHAFAAGRTRPVEWRRQQLARLEAMLTEHEAEFAAALKADLGKSEHEAWMTEIEFVRGEARHTAKRLAKWMRPRRVPTPLLAMPGRSRIHAEPLAWR